MVTKTNKKKMVKLYPNFPVMKHYSIVTCLGLIFDYKKKWMVYISSVNYHKWGTLIRALFDRGKGCPQTCSWLGSSPGSVSMQKLS